MLVNLPIKFSLLLRLLLTVILSIAIPGAGASVSNWVNIEIINGQVMLPINIAGVDGYAMLDSGSQLHALNSALLESDDSLASGAGIRIQGAFGTDKSLRQTFNNVPAKLFGAELSIDSMVNADLGSNTLAILGQAFWDSFIVQLDYPNKRMRIMSHKAINLRKQDNIKMKREKGESAIIQVTVDGNNGWYIFDTGSNGGLLLERSVAERAGWTQENSVEGGSSQGLVTNADTLHFRVPEVNFGPYTLEHVAVAVPAQGSSLKFIAGNRIKNEATHIKKKRVSGLVGYDVFKHFVLTVDYKRAVMHVGLPEQL